MDELELEEFSGMFDARSVWFRLEPDDARRRLTMTMHGPAEDSWEFIELEMLRVSEYEFVSHDAPETVCIRFHGDPASGIRPFAEIDFVGVRWSAVRLGLQQPGETQGPFR